MSSQGGKSSRVVNCVLALKSYAEWKQAGSIGVWRFGGNVKQVTSAKQFGRKNPEPFTSSLSRTASLNEKSVNCASTENEPNKEVAIPSYSIFYASSTISQNLGVIHCNVPLYFCSTTLP